MDKKKKLVGFMGVTLSISIGLIFFIQAIANAEKICRIEKLKVVRISGNSGEQGTLKIEPANLDITAGDCVVWVNWSKGPEVMVVFQEGKVCHDVTRAPGGFSINASNCYVTNFIPYGGTSSLSFKEKGTFKYEVMTAAGKAVKCQLTVHEEEK